VALRLLAPQRGLTATVRSKSKNKSKDLVLLSSLPRHRLFEGEHTPGTLKVLLPPRQSRGISSPFRPPHSCAQWHFGRRIPSLAHKDSGLLLTTFNRLNRHDHGLPLAVRVTSASPNESTLVEATLSERHNEALPKRLIGNTAYDCDALDERLQQEQASN